MLDEKTRRMQIKNEREQREKQQRKELIKKLDELIKKNYEKTI